MEMPHSHHPAQMQMQMDMQMQLPTPYDLPLDSSCSNQPFDWDKLSPIPLPDDIHLLLENTPASTSVSSTTHSHAPSSVGTGLSLDSCIDPWLQPTPDMDQWTAFEWTSRARSTPHQHQQEAQPQAQTQTQADAEADMDYDDLEDDDAEEEEENSPSPSRITRSTTKRANQSASTSTSRSTNSPQPTSNPNSNPKQLTGKRKAHYRIEKRYRTNINDKIRALEEMLPKPPSGPNGHGHGPAPGLGLPGSDGSGGSRKSKGEVLSRVIDYIIALRGKDAWQEKKIEELSRRIRASRQALDL